MQNSLTTLLKVPCYSIQLHSVTYHNHPQHHAAQFKVSPSSSPAFPPYSLTQNWRTGLTGRTTEGTRQVCVWSGGGVGELRLAPSLPHPITSGISEFSQVGRSTLQDNWVPNPGGRAVLKDIRDSKVYKIPLCPDVTFKLYTNPLPVSWRGNFSSHLLSSLLLTI